MFRMYSRGCEYAIWAMLDIAVHGRRGHVAVKDLCRRTKVPEPSTRKVVQRLVRRGLLRSVPGPSGGYQLSRTPERISILDIIQAIDGPGALEVCVLGFPACNDRTPCALHPTWNAARRSLLPALGKLTLQDLMRDGYRRPVRSARVGLKR